MIPVTTTSCNVCLGISKGACSCKGMRVLTSCNKCKGMRVLTSCNKCKGFVEDCGHVQ